MACKNHDEEIAAVRHGILQLVKMFDQRLHFDYSHIILGMTVAIAGLLVHGSEDVDAGIRQFQEAFTAAVEMEKKLLAEGPDPPSVH